MRCERCKVIISDGEEKELHGEFLCEDCYMDLLSPLKACDPWAVYSAKNLIKDRKHNIVLTAIQKEILDVLKEKGAVEPRILAEMLQIEQKELERELATLRHMEKVRGELYQGKKRIRLW